MELAGRVDDVDARVGVLEAPQILDVAAHAEVIIEVAHHACAQVPAEHVVRRGNVEGAGEASAVNLRADQTEAAGHEGPDTGAARAADWHADDYIAHQVDDAVVAEV